jgi:hypothetical protein
VVLIVGGRRLVIDDRSTTGIILRVVALAWRAVPKMGPSPDGGVAAHRG